MITFPRLEPDGHFYRFGTRNRHWAFCRTGSTQYIKANPQSLTLSTYAFKGSTRVKQHGYEGLYVKKQPLPHLTQRNHENWEFYFPRAKALYFRFNY